MANKARPYHLLPPDDYSGVEFRIPNRVMAQLQAIVYDFGDVVDRDQVVAELIAGFLPVYRDQVLIPRREGVDPSTP